ncbi:hypothetical protein V6O07_21455 [Arthrospira platensis SPKY2]
MIENNFNKIDAIAIMFLRDISAFLTRINYTVLPRSPYSRAVSETMLDLYSKNSPTHLGRVDLFHKILGDWYAAGTSYWIMGFEKNKRQWLSVDPLNIHETDDGNFCCLSQAKNSLLFYSQKEIIKIPWSAICKVPLRNILHEVFAIAVAENFKVDRINTAHQSIQNLAESIFFKFCRENPISNADVEIVIQEILAMKEKKMLFSATGENFKDDNQRNENQKIILSQEWISSLVMFTLTQCISYSAPFILSQGISDKVEKQLRSSRTTKNILPFLAAISESVNVLISKDISHPLYCSHTYFAFGGKNAAP